jgi:hypothetical protein
MACSCDAEPGSYRGPLVLLGSVLRNAVLILDVQDGASVAPSRPLVTNPTSLSASGASAPELKVTLLEISNLSCEIRTTSPRVFCAPAGVNQMSDVEMGWLFVTPREHHSTIPIARESRYCLSGRYKLDLSFRTETLR